MTPSRPDARTNPSTWSQAELLARLNTLPCAPSFTLEACPAERMRLELGTHRIELEVQNQELRESRQRIEEARDRYADLYDFAPVGYATLDKQGCVQEINLTGAAMLGCERGSLLGKPLLLWLDRDDHEIFLQHLQRVFASSERVVNEVSLHGPDAPSHHVSLTSIAIRQGEGAGNTCCTVLVDITPLKAKEAKLSRSRQKLRDLSAHLCRVREEERRRLAREIHDELGQKLTVLRFEVALLEVGLEPSQPELRRRADSLLKRVDETIESIRAIASNLRPAVLDLGLAAAIEWQVRDFQKHSGIVCELELDDADLQLDENRATAIFRIVQESLTNILRHARASRIKLSLCARGERLQLQISDDGIGLTPEVLKKSQSFGITGMRERVRLLNGKLNLSGHPGQGTQLKVSIPMRGKEQ